MLERVMLLACLYQLKHFVADYPLQANRYMLGKFRDDWGFVGPLLAHVAVHGGLTALITVWLVGPWCLALAVLDATIHFGMDRLKAGRRYLGRFKPLTAETGPTATPRQWRENNYFWWAVGFDQMVHHMTHYAIIYLCLR
jgi:hypothetical protein